MHDPDTDQGQSLPRLILQENRENEKALAALKTILHNNQALNEKIPWSGLVSVSTCLCASVEVPADTKIGIYISFPYSQNF